MTEETSAQQPNPSRDRAAPREHPSRSSNTRSKLSNDSSSRSCTPSLNCVTQDVEEEPRGEYSSYSHVFQGNIQSSQRVHFRSKVFNTTTDHQAASCSSTSVHPNTDEEQLIECQVCSSFIPLKHMSKHMNVSHPSTVLSSSSSSSSSFSKKEATGLQRNQESNGMGNGTSGIVSESSAPSMASKTTGDQPNVTRSSQQQTTHDATSISAATSNEHETHRVESTAHVLRSLTRQDIHLCSLCGLTFDTTEEAADHEMAHRLQSEEDEQFVSPGSDNYYQVILSNFQRNANPEENRPQATQVFNTAECSEDSQECNLPLPSFITGRTPTVWIATTPCSAQEGHGRLISSDGSNSLISPIALLSQQLVSGECALSLDEWITRFRFGDTVTEAHTTSNTNATPQEVIRTLPIYSYADIPPTQQQCLGSLDVDPDVCMICLDEYNAKDELRQLPCLHYFHVSCIDAWLQRSQLCPACKRCVIQGENNNITLDVPSDGS